VEWCTAVDFHGFSSPFTQSFTPFLDCCVFLAAVPMLRQRIDALGLAIKMDQESSTVPDSEPLTSQGPWICFVDCVPFSGTRIFSTEGTILVTNSFHGGVTANERATWNCGSARHDVGSNVPLGGVATWAHPINGRAFSVLPGTGS